MSKVRGINRICNNCGEKFTAFAIKGSYVCPKCKYKGEVEIEKQKKKR